LRYRSIGKNKLSQLKASMDLLAVSHPDSSIAERAASRPDQRRGPQAKGVHHFAQARCCRRRAFSQRHVRQDRLDVR
jgi:hypothetical protein